MYLPRVNDSGGELRWYTRAADRDPYDLVNCVLAEWTGPATRQDLQAALDEHLRQLKRSVGAVETGIHFPGFKATTVTDRSSAKFLVPLRGPGRTLI